MRPLPRRLLTTAVTALLVSGLAACATTTSEPASTAAPAPARAGTPALGSFGFDVAGMDRAVAAGDDFYLHANGGWMRDTEIPADRSSYNSFTSIALETEKQVRNIIEGAAKDGSATGDLRKVGDYYTAFMDEAGIEARGLAPVKPRLDAIAGIGDRRALAREFGEQLRADVDLLNATDYYTDRPFGLWITQDLNDPSRNVPYLVQGGLGLPDRSFYLDGGRAAEIRKAYQAHVQKVLELAGIDDAAARATRILALETAIARVHATQEQTNDVEAGNNAWTQADFARKAPGLDWPVFMQAADLASQRDFIVWQPRAVAGISQLAASQPLQTWKDYLAFHAIDRASSYLPRAFADERFAFYDRTLNGTPQQRERWKRAVSATSNALGEAVGREYVTRHVDPKTKARAEEMVRNIVAAFGRRIDALDWMSPQTKAAAKAKVDSLEVAVAYPSKWRDYSTLEVRADDPVGNAERAEMFEYRRNLAKLSQPVSHDEWYMTPQIINALNVPLENRLIFPAAILQPPFFDPNADDAVNYGAIGSVIGHEISHSFDNTGALFDAQGRLHNWWTKEDFAKFDAAGKALSAQFSTYKPFPDLAVNGDLTLGENIADVAGIATALDGYRLSLQGREVRTIDGFTPEQRFFLGFAQAWRSKYRDAAMRNAILTDVHAPGRYRAQTVRNIDAWYEAFGVQPGQALYLAPEQRVKVW
ncbi:peptidase M13 [Lysobacter xinjiangensis]|uniref:Peptidase M13 n=1 Tax=Cognatilysobacter xinjiangensis TaxID=546892 RepID=A0ABQ3C407_9GAMM|nr:M13 family metallopeptidase [Lysobacter xinjiangensis]GGZ64317.1 peptidase M13 [Lysobacter xinjiangensis]